ncbi:hypothetical protein, partial [Chamaesiphon sp. OTE_75_metabat_556]|uniref:hypothetical protein n=1 Tax=Chamaesiphon sp. OTE_75_metabat_556 TaxID=2964692 RepID=UPI00286C9DB0
LRGGVPVRAGWVDLRHTPTTEYLILFLRENAFFIDPQRINTGKPALKRVYTNKQALSIPNPQFQAKDRC